MPSEGDCRKSQCKTLTKGTYRADLYRWFLFPLEYILIHYSTENKRKKLERRRSSAAFLPKNQFEALSTDFVPSPAPIWPNNMTLNKVRKYSFSRTASDCCRRMSWADDLQHWLPSEEESTQPLKCQCRSSPSLRIMANSFSSTPSPPGWPWGNGNPWNYLVTGKNFQSPWFMTP